MKKNLLLCGLCALFALSCNKTPQQEQQPKDPIFEVGETEIPVAAEGGVYQATYIIDNPTPTGMVDAVSQVDWITIVSTQSYGIVSFEVAANEVDTPREGVIDMVYEGVEHSVTVVQEAGELGLGSDYLYEATDVTGIYYAFQFSDVPNYYFHLSEQGFDNYTNPKPNTWYYCIDLYSLQEPQGEVVRIPNGTYRLDTSNTSSDSTFSAGYSLYYFTDNTGEVAVEARFVEGTLTVSDEGMHLMVTDESGKTHSVKYSGNDYSLIKLNNDEPDIPELDDELSSLDSDVEVVTDGMYVSAAYYGDYYKNEGGNWVLYFIPGGGNGNLVQIDLNTGVTGISADISGTYQCSAQPDHYSFVKGEYYEGYFLGSWLLEMANGSINPEGQYAAFMSGTLVITKESDDSYLFELEVYDSKETPNCVTMTFSAPLSIVDYSSPAARLMRKGF